MDERADSEPVPAAIEPVLPLTLDYCQDCFKKQGAVGCGEGEKKTEQKPVAFCCFKCKVTLCRECAMTFHRKPQADKFSYDKESLAVQQGHLTVFIDKFFKEQTETLEAVLASAEDGWLDKIEKVIFLEQQIYLRSVIYQRPQCQCQHCGHQLSSNMPGLKHTICLDKNGFQEYQKMRAFSAYQESVLRNAKSSKANPPKPMEMNYQATFLQSKYFVELIQLKVELESLIEGIKVSLAILREVKKRKQADEFRRIEEEKQIIALESSAQTQDLVRAHDQHYAKDKNLSGFELVKVEQTILDHYKQLYRERTGSLLSEVMPNTSIFDFKDKYDAHIKEYLAFKSTKMPHLYQIQSLFQIVLKIIDKEKYLLPKLASGSIRMAAGDSDFEEEDCEVHFAENELKVAEVQRRFPEISKGIQDFLENFLVIKSVNQFTNKQSKPEEDEQSKAGRKLKRQKK